MSAAETWRTPSKNISSAPPRGDIDTFEYNARVPSEARFGAADNRLAAQRASDYRPARLGLFWSDYKRWGHRTAQANMSGGKPANVHRRNVGWALAVLIVLGLIVLGGILTG
jgi:hypothetical protein